MSEENVEVVRSVYEAAARRDDVTPFELYAPGIEWEVGKRRAAVGFSRVYRGHQGVRQFWRDALDAFDEMGFELEELIDAGDQVLAVVREREVGRSSGVPLEQRVYAVWTLRDGKIVRMQAFDQRAEAEREAGLGE
jgi:ketosteroid isomerase-like protein